MRKLKSLFIIFACALIVQSSYAQIKVSKRIQASNIATQESNTLYFVDFWATWCAPCINAKKYLSTLQNQFPADLYIVSLSQESPETVEKFLRKRPTDLAVAIDYDKETFRKHTIKSLPKGILFNAEGDILWEGHPADFMGSHIRRFIKKNDKKIAVDKFIQLKEYEKEKMTKTVYEPEEDFELMDSDRTSGMLEVNEFKDYTSYDGNLKSILAYLFKAYNEQVQLSEEVSDAYYKLHINHSSRKHKNLVKHILKKLRLKIENSSKTGEVMSLQIDNPKFWDTNQINWGIGNPKYLIDDAQIQADNVPFNDIKYRLSNLLQMPVIANNLEISTNHDWQIHYKYFQLMQSDLADNFGIRAKKLTTEYPVYIIQKKTP